MHGRVKSIPDFRQLSEDDLVGNAVKHTRVSASVPLDRLSHKTALTRRYSARSMGLHRFASASRISSSVLVIHWVLRSRDSLRNNVRTAAIRLINLAFTPCPSPDAPPTTPADPVFGSLLYDGTEPNPAFEEEAIC